MIPFLGYIGIYDLYSILSNSVDTYSRIILSSLTGFRLSTHFYYVLSEHYFEIINKCLVSDHQISNLPF